MAALGKDSERLLRAEESSSRNPSKLGSLKERHQKSKCSCSLCCLNHYILAANLVCWPTLKSDIWPIKGWMEFSICCSTLPSTAQCQRKLHFRSLSWAACRQLNGHDSVPPYATTLKEHLTSRWACSLESVPHPDSTTFQVVSIKQEVPKWTSPLECCR